MSSSSQSGHGHGQAAEETPSWDQIACTLKSLLSESEVDLSRVGATQRLQYEDFEAIFHHLFTVIDPAETKRRFRRLCSARSQEEKNKFVDAAVRFINDKQLLTQRVSPTQLKMFGGEPFRRLTSSLIKVACERELARHDFNSEEDLGDLQGRARFDKILQMVEEKSHSLSQDVLNLCQSMERLRDLRKSVEDTNQEIRDKWTFLERLACVHEGTSLAEDSSNCGGESSCSSNNLNCHRDVSPVVKALLEQLGDSHSQAKAAMEKINAIDLPEEVALSQSERVSRKRLSQLIREAANKFSTSQEPDARQTELNDQIKKQFADYDARVRRLIERWRAEEDLMDDELLTQPDVREIYAQLEKMIPLIELSPIAPNKQLDTRPSVKFSDIETILKAYPNPNYDEQEILDGTRKHFSS